MRVIANLAKLGGPREEDSAVSSQNGSGSSLGHFWEPDGSEAGLGLRIILHKWFWLQFGALLGTPVSPTSPAQSEPERDSLHPLLSTLNFTQLHSPQLNST